MLEETFKKGEEILEDYSHYQDPLWLTKLNNKYGLLDLESLVDTLNNGHFQRDEDNSLKIKDG